MASTSTSTNSNISPAQANAMATAALLQNGIRIVRPLPPVSVTPGSYEVIKLDRFGVFTGVRIQVSVTLNNRNSSAEKLTPSPFAPYNVFTRVVYHDFDGNDRINSAPFFVYAVESFKQRTLGPRIPSSLNNLPSLLSVPTSIPAGGSATLEYEQHIPISYSGSDFTGAVLAQVSSGQHQLEFNVGQIFGNDPWTSTYVGALPSGVTIGSITVTVYQEVVQPQNYNQLPLLSMGIAYGINGNLTDSTNLVQGQTKHINYANARKILSLGVAYDNGNTFNNGSDITEFELLSNSSLYILKCNPQYLQQRMREHLAGDMPNGFYYFGSRAQPIDTSIYGNFQVGMKPSVVNSGAYLAYYFESLYPLGAPLPGIAVG
jgi:hypothetical protein